MLSEEFLKGFGSAIRSYHLATHPADRPRNSPRIPPRNPQGAYDSALSFETWLRSLSPKQVRRAKLAFDEVMQERRRESTATQGETLPQSGDQEQPLPDEVMELLRSKLSEEELEFVCMALQQRAEDQEKEDQEARQPPAQPSRDEPPPFSGRPRTNAGASGPISHQDSITSTLRGGGSQTAAAMDASPRIRSETSAELTYINGTPANGVIGGVRYLHGLAWKHETEAAPRAAASEDFASRFPEIARVRVV